MYKQGCVNCALLGAASTSDDELSSSVDDEECPFNREQPHLRFEISSDDGFAVEADSIEGKLNLCEIKCCVKCRFNKWHLILNPPFSGLESSDRRCAGGSSDSQTPPSDLPEDHWCRHAGTDP